MKLSPPASSSDLDAAREIARRMHQRRRREDRPHADGPWPAFDEGPSLVATSPPPAPRPGEAARPAAHEPAPSPAPPAPPAPPSWDEPLAPGVSALDALDALEGLGEPPPPRVPRAAANVAPIDIEEPPVSPEEMVGLPEPPPLEDLTAGGPVPPSPFDVEIDEAPSEDMVEMPAAGPSWDEVVVACLDVAKARGAMLIDPAGQVFAARGDWPDPGPDAIAKKLVSTLDRTLKDAPTRSISAPLMGKHLTAWRVPLTEGLVTAAFIGDAPVRAEARPAIDAEIHRGPGA